MNMENEMVWNISSIKRRKYSETLADSVLQSQKLILTSTGQDKPCTSFRDKTSLARALGLNRVQTYLFYKYKNVS
jgi:hypothetical protein